MKQKKHFNTTHGFCGTRFYHIWATMFARCNNKNSHKYPYYGGRGVKYMWQSFENFKDDMYESYLTHIEKYGEKNTQIDRIDVNGNYCKENCRWATILEQARNRNNNRFLTLKGKTRTLGEWSEKLKINYKTLHTRLSRGWAEEKVLSVV